MKLPIHQTEPAREAVQRLAHHLEALTMTLPPHEEAILGAVLQAAMDPLDRIRHRAASNLLTVEEARLLGELLAIRDTRPPR